MHTALPPTSTTSPIASAQVLADAASSMPHVSHWLAGLGLLAGLTLWLFGHKTAKPGVLIVGALAGAGAGITLGASLGIGQILGLDAPTAGLIAGTLGGLIAGLIMHRVLTVVGTTLVFATIGLGAGAIAVHLGTPGIAARPSDPTPVPGAQGSALKETPDRADNDAIAGFDPDAHAGESRSAVFTEFGEPTGPLPRITIGTPIPFQDPVRTLGVLAEPGASIPLSRMVEPSVGPASLNEQGNRTLSKEPSDPGSDILATLLDPPGYAWPDEDWTDLTPDEQPAPASGPSNPTDTTSPSWSERIEERFLDLTGGLGTPYDAFGRELAERLDRPAPIDDDTRRDLGAFVDRLAGFATKLGDSAQTRLGETTPDQRRLLAATTMGGGLFGLLVGLTMPRRSITLVTALGGAALWLACGAWLATEAGIPGIATLAFTPGQWVGIWATASLIGVGYQFTRRRPHASPSSDG